MKNSSRQRHAALLLFSYLLATFCVETCSFSPESSRKSNRIPSSSFGLQQSKSPKHDNMQNDDDASSSYRLQVSYEGRTCQTQIRKGEPILTALERTGAADALSMPSLPSDCRRGNCLTCVGKHLPTSSGPSNLVRGEDGLSPSMSREAKKRGYILTCSSYITGHDVHLELGANQQAWDDLYRGRFEDESTQLIGRAAGRAAVAKTIRFHAEEFPEEWVKETEEILRKTTSSSTDL